MQKATKRPTVVSNWYILGKQLHWWFRNESKPGTAGTTKGQDHNGLKGQFTGHQATVTAWKRHDKNSWLITGSDGNQYLAQFSTRYNNWDYSTQCARNVEDVEKKLTRIVASD